MPNYVFSLACYRGAEPLVGAVYDPNREELFPARSLRESLIGTNLMWDMRPGRFPALPGLQELGRRVRGMRSLGAAPLLVAEAGGRVTQMSGASLDPTQPCSVVASNGAIHGEMLELLGRSPETI